MALLIKPMTSGGNSKRVATLLPAHLDASPDQQLADRSHDFDSWQHWRHPSGSCFSRGQNQRQRLQDIKNCTGKRFTPRHRLTH